jgi:peptidoglycan/xylan/chitin deacetylase (PgdA/CDA1 family)
LPALRSRILAAARAHARTLLLRVAGVPLAHLVRRAAELSGRSAGVALVYHRVGDPAGNPRRELVPALGRSLFAAQVRHLAGCYSLVGASDLLAASRERQRRTRFPVAITFDDDLASHADVAAPILTSAGASATFFVSGASLRGPHRFWWERLQVAVDRGLDLTELGLGPATEKTRIHQLGLVIQNLPARDRDAVDARLAQLLGPDPGDSGLRIEALNRLVASGLEIGFHTRRHDLLPRLGDEELREAMRDGLGELGRVVGRPIRTISYPHGRAGAQVAAAAREAGFEAGFTGSAIAVTAESDPLLLGRLAPSYRSVGELAFDVSWALLRAGLSGRARARAARRDRPESQP